MSVPNPHVSRIETEAVANLARLASATGRDLHNTAPAQARDRATPEPLRRALAAPAAYPLDALGSVLV